MAFFRIDRATGRNKGTRMCLAVAAALLAALLDGCGGAAAREVAVIPIDAYEKEEYEAAIVQRGDLYPTATLTLLAEGFQRIYYDVDDEDLELERLYVALGDVVREGDLLVSFKADGIEEQIAAYEEQRSQYEMLIEHYENLMKADAGLDYEADIENLRQDIAVADLYIEELAEKLSEYRICAEADGMITKVSMYLVNGYYMDYVAGTGLITETCGSAKFSAAKPDGYEFAVGETYAASDGSLTYEMAVVDVDGDEVVFAPVSDASSLAVTDTLKIVVEKEPLIDVVYVDATAVHTNGDKSFVYLLDGDGYRDAVYVTTGGTVDGYVVITDGLDGGEQVAL